MNLEEAIAYLREKDIILESPEFTPRDKYRFGRHVAMTSRSNEEAGRDKVRFSDPGTYNDSEGLKWLDVKKRDTETLLSAIVDGMIDAKHTVEEEYLDDEELGMSKDLSKEYNEYNTTSDLLEILRKNSFEGIAEEIINFLKMHVQGVTTVYRGYSFTEDEYKAVIDGIDARIQTNLLKVLNNQTKRFNSFSTSLETAAEFAGVDDSSKQYTHKVLIAAEVEPNDINFAFSAYLMARHNGISECELNINNMKGLKNLRLIRDINRERQLIVKRLPTYNELKNINGASDLNRLFSHKRVLNMGNGKELYLGIYKDSGYMAIMDENKVLTPLFSGYLSRYYKDYVALPEKGYGRKGYRIYKLGKGYITEIYKQFDFYSDCDMVVGTTWDDKCQMINLNTNKPMFKNLVKEIDYIPKLPYAEFPGKWFKITAVNGTQTIIDSNGQCVFVGKLKIFDDLKVNTIGDGNTVTCKIDTLTKTYKLKNNKLIEVLG